MSAARELVADVQKCRRRYARAFKAWERSRSDADDQKTTRAYIEWARAQARLMDAEGRPGEAQRLRIHAAKYEAQIAA